MRVPDVVYNTVYPITASASEFEGLEPYFELYNFFRLKKCIVRFIPDQNVNTSVWNGTETLTDRIPTIVTAPLQSNNDIEDGTPPMVPDLRSYYRAKEQRYTRVHTRSFVPYVQQLLEVNSLASGSNFTIAKNIYTPWLATNSYSDVGQNPANCQHSGLFWGLSAPAQYDVDGPYGTVEYVITLVIEFKSPKPSQ